MKRLLSTTLLLLCIICANAQIFYKISGNGLKKPSYLLGTYHLASKEYIEKIPNFQQAFDGTEQCCGELVMEDMFKTENTQKVLAAINLPGDSTAMQLLNKEQMEKYNAFIKSIIGVDLTNPMVTKQLGRMRPSMVITQLATMFLRNKEYFTLEQNSVIDNALQSTAKSAGKSIIGLETIDEQIEALYGLTGMEDEVKDLMEFLDNQEKGKKQAEDLFDAYINQDIKRLEDCFTEANMSTDVEERIAYKRNENWLKAMPGIMKEKPTFFHVGALHLVKEKGLLNQLRLMGYKVEAVK